MDLPALTAPLELSGALAVRLGDLEDLQAEWNQYDAHEDQRQEAIHELAKAGWLRVSDEQRTKMLESDDALDALVASLNARAAKLGLTLRPQPDQHREAAREGWIAIPEEGSLEKLLGSGVSRV